ncbi:aminotransferase class III-fold pyridoxal phosphate-dependent enzyme, partial [Shewanella sp.]|uniref:aminotransferase class III-fold pyridoxal phosphate-dependent enzyme n=1 Tax=Shewanella sp. TaxID=50422 RepID=UPI00258A95D8
MTDSIKTDKIWQQDKNHFIHPYTDFSTFHEEGSQVITKAKGNFVSDSQGNTFLDGIAGLWCVNIGHGREDMADAIHK